MKGVILAGGTGSRLHPLTRVTNKHLLPVYDKPMLYYPLQTLVDAGIKDILIVTGGNNAGDFLRLLRNGKDFGLKQLSFAYQEGEGGNADALRLAEPFAAGEKICVILGDNILENGIQAAKEKFERQEEGALVLLKKVPDPERFGVPVFEGKRIAKIEEKPKLASSPYAIIGVYFYDGTVFDRVRPLRPSGRGEVEITDVNNSYLRDGKLEHEIIEGGWTSAGTFESLWRATKMMREKALLAQELARATASRMQVFVPAPLVGSNEFQDEGIEGYPPPLFFVSAHSKGVTGAVFVSAHSKGLMDGQFRPKPGKTRCLLISAHSKGVRERLNAPTSERPNVREEGTLPPPGNNAKV